MSSAFDTIQRGQLIDIAKEILNKDEIRILRVVLAETILEVKVENAKATPFESNIGWPQGESINWPLVTTYFNRALQQIREETGKEPINVRDINVQWPERMKSNLLDEMMYTDDCDFIKELE